MKTCPACHAEKETAAFNLRNKAKGILASRCIECERAHAKAWRVRHADTLAAKRKANRETIAEYGERYRSGNREKLRQAAREYWAANHEERLAKQRAHRAANREQSNAKARADYQRNPTYWNVRAKRWRAKNPGYSKSRAAQMRAWWAANKAMRALYDRKRRALKRGAKLHSFSMKDLDARMSVFGYRCAYCGGPFEHVDHVKRLSKGGPHCLSNLRPSCASCNLHKLAKHPRDWLNKVAS